MIPEQAPAPHPRRFRPGRLRFLVPLAVYLVHLGLVLYAFSHAAFFGGEPVMGIDYMTHFEQTRTVDEALTRFGRTWAYDPDLLAGQPAGLFFDVDNKAHALWSFALHRLGLDLAVAFNLFVLLAHLLAPLTVWLAARLLQTGPGPQTLSLGLAVLLWHFDSQLRWYWCAGMVSFALASCLAVLVAALFFRLLAKKRWVLLAPLLLLLPLTLLIHVWSFAILVVPLLALYLRAWRGLRVLGHLAVWGLALAALLANAYWLWPALQHFDLFVPSGRGGQATPINIFTDYLDIFTSSLVGGTIVMRTFFRTVAFCGAALTLWQWRRERDDRFFFGAVALLWLLAQAYLFALVPALEETEPYRFVAPAALLAAVLAGPWLARALSTSWLRDLPPLARVVLGVLLLLLVPRAVGSILSFFPELLPRERIEELAEVPIQGPGALEPASLLSSWRHERIPQDYRDLATYLTREATEEGRVAVEWWALAEYLRWATRKPIAGGFPDRRMIFEQANVFRYNKDPRQRGGHLAHYLVRYNIRYMVLTNLNPQIENRRDLLEFKQFVGPHRVYHVRHRANYFAKGSGRVRASLNRIEVDRARPEPGSQSLVLRFHYMDTLRCAPACTLSPERLPDSRASFIRVRGQDRLPDRFVITNRY